MISVAGLGVLCVQGETLQAESGVFYFLMCYIGLKSFVHVVQSRFCSRDA